MEHEKQVDTEMSPESGSKPSYAVPLDAVPKSRWERSWPTIACGAGLFSDGYLNGVWRIPSHCRVMLSADAAKRSLGPSIPC
jgi:hypothetical protein